MNKLKKTLVLVCCAALLVCISVGATVAYLTSQTQVVNNTFTVGKVAIDLDEAPVNEEGEVVPGARVKENEYKLMPGHEYVKDPMVTVKGDSEESYIRMIVTINDIEDLCAACDVDVFMPEDFVTGWDSAKWPCYQMLQVGDSVVCEFRYHETVSTEREAEKALEPLFQTIKVPGTATNDEILALDDLEINIIAHAIQADGFADADAAWATWDE